MSMLLGVLLLGMLLLDTFQHPNQPASEYSSYTQFIHTVHDKDVHADRLTGEN